MEFITENDVAIAMEKNNCCKSEAFSLLLKQLSNQWLYANFPPKDVTIVKVLAECSREEALASLQHHKGDIVNAIGSISNIVN